MRSEQEIKERRDGEFRRGFPMFRGQIRRRSQGDGQRTRKDVVLEAP